MDNTEFIEIDPHEIRGLDNNTKRIIVFTKFSLIKTVKCTLLCLKIIF